MTGCAYHPERPAVAWVHVRYAHPGYILPCCADCTAHRKPGSTDTPIGEDPHPGWGATTNREQVL